MITLKIPDIQILQLKNIVLDYNGTIACDGELIEGLKDKLIEISKQLDVHILTADTYGNVESKLKGLPVTLATISSVKQDEKKLEYVKKLGCENTVCMGNGCNDRLMLKNAIIGIALIQDEGLSVDSLFNADIVCKDIISALEILINKKRMIATLRN